ncbi:MAG: TerB family tellurite resistance protein [Candidatus Hydrogenedentes bacterium]|nr:TerB family tellurite resistance protein [Candidatus Hydrogenedentota bacterium]
MFKNLQNLFAQEEQQPEALDRGERVKIATCVLMLEVARIDEEFSDDERDRILTTLCERYALSDAEAQELMQLSTESREQSVDLWRFTHEINKLCKEAEKIEIVEEVWRVVVADGGIHGNETHFMRQLAALLNLTRHQIIDAKVKILDEVRGPG